MKRDLGLYLEDMLKSMDIIEQHTKGVTEEGFYQSILLQDAVVRRLEIIGEAAKHIPARVRDKYPDTPWQDIAGMRNRLAHEYFGIQLRRTWKVVKQDLPGLKDTVLKMTQALS